LSYSTLPEIGLPENRRAGVSHDRSRYLQTAWSAQPPHHPRHPRRPRPYPVETDTMQLRTVPLRTGRHRRGEQPDPLPRPATREAYEERLREIAFERFIRKSAGLAAAHASHRRPSIATRLGAAFKRAVRHVTRASRPAPAAVRTGTALGGA
jgi:hypothetical protein